jgi:hypothetical protein
MSTLGDNVTVCVMLDHVATKSLVFRNISLYVVKTGTGNQTYNIRMLETSKYWKVRKFSEGSTEGMRPA